MPVVSKNGFPCASCGLRMTVTQTKTDSLGRLVRYRKCGCGHKTTTREMAIALGNTLATISIKSLIDNCGTISQ